MLRKLFLCISVFVLILNKPRVAAAQQPPVAVPVPRRLALADAERLLLERNLAVAVNRRLLEAAEAAKLIASYKPNPSLQLGAEQISVQSPLPDGAPRFFATNPNAGANSVYTILYSKLIERGGKRELRTSQATAQVAGARAQILDTYRQNLLTLRQAYGTAVLARINLDLASKALADYEKTEKLTITRVQNGDAAQVDLYRIQSGKLPYQQAVLQAAVAYKQACFDVLNLLSSRTDDVVVTPAPAASGDPVPDAPLDIEAEFSDRPPLLALDELKRISLLDRPDVELARRSLEAGQFGTRLAEAQRHRDLTVGLEMQRVGDDYTAGVTLNFPLFLYNNQKAGIVQARALERAAGHQVKQAELQALTDVEKAWQAFLAAQQALKVYSKENLEQTEKLRTVAQFMYREGATSLFELLDAQRTAYQARQAYNQARFDLQNSLWLIEAATGRELEGVKP